MLKLKFIPILFCMLIVGCSSFKEAKQNFDEDMQGFKKEWARVVLKKQDEH